MYALFLVVFLVACNNGEGNRGDSGTDNSGYSGTNNNGDSGGDNGGGSGGDNSGGSGAPATKLAVVTNIQATAVHEQVTLSWATADGVDSYNIYYAEESFSGLSGGIANYIKLNGGTLESAITNTPKTIQGLTNYIKYYFVVTSVQGSRESEASKEVSVATHPHPQRLNDTGITWGGSYDSGNNKSCTSNNTIDASQDCDQGRDAQAVAGTLVKTGSGEAGFDFHQT